MSFELTDAELERAFQAIEHHGYSALLPTPPEWGEVRANWGAIQKAIAAIDLDGYQLWEGEHLLWQGLESAQGVGPGSDNGGSVTSRPC